MINFNQTLAADFVAALDSDDPKAAVSVYQSIIQSSGVKSCKDAIKNCVCDSISYNNEDLIRTRLAELLPQIAAAGVNLAFGYLIPEFLCLAEKLLTLRNNDGKTRSKPLRQGTDKDPSGS